MHVRKHRAAGAAIFLFALSTRSDAETQPNILLILADNTGWDDSPNRNRHFEPK